jgi:hypothetical protein
LVGRAICISPLRGSSFAFSTFIVKIIIRSSVNQWIVNRNTVFVLRDTVYADQILIYKASLSANEGSREGSFFERDSETRPALQIPNDFWKRDRWVLKRPREKWGEFVEETEHENHESISPAKGKPDQMGGSGPWIHGMRRSNTPHFFLSLDFLRLFCIKTKETMCSFEIRS